MKQNKHGIGKWHIMAQLRTMGLTAERKTVNGERAWVLSDGRKFASLREIADALKIPA